MNLVLDDVPEPATNWPLYWYVGDVGELRQFDAVYFVETFECALAFHREPELQALMRDVRVRWIEFPNAIEQSSDVVMLDFRDVHEVLTEGSRARMRAEIQLVLGNEFESLQTDAAKSLIVLAKDAYFVSGYNDRCASHEGECIAAGLREELVSWY
jgi:hypothetical protein